MKKNFFSLSENAFKYRRNVLFVSAFCYVHFQVSSLSNLKVFNVSIPENIISIGLPICIAWFSLNYFYNLYAEYVEWKVSHIDDAESQEGMLDWKGWTLIPEIVVMNEKRIEIKTEFSSSISHSEPQPITDQRIREETEKLNEYVHNQTVSAISMDIERIKKFQDAINQYQIAHRFRFYILDFGIPLVCTIMSVYLFLNQS